MHQEQWGDEPGEHLGTRAHAARLALAFVVCTLASCSDSSRPFGGDDGGGRAGRTGAGGTTATGGSVASGGATATGGVSASGGANATGGVIGTGGRGNSGGGTAGSGGHGSGGNSSSTGGSTSTGGMNAAAPCPATQPAGGACARDGLVCEYGTDPRPPCRTRATCTGGSWTLALPRCVPVPAAVGGCPASRELAQGHACSPDAAICSYQGLNCLCASCAPNGPLGCTPNPATLAWYCEAPSTDAACPAATPRLGGPCVPEGKQCTYTCGAEGARLCRSGVWTSADGSGCPRSNRVLKRDIHYLDDAEVQQQARRVAALRLATWRYKDPALGAGPHLGFIIEDQPDIAAVDSTRGMVDLYGYASMLAAAVQAQQREIEALRREVDALRTTGVRRLPTAPHGSRSPRPTDQR
ncbi:MAG: tail fiber domain-containing protein [Myxococcales bacterium]